ncbi:hypothetical protein [Bradyrhizobium sp. 1(2017)]|nr:hypothetical protein [Bradyrhizobium sp. 1(2017)]
MRTTRVPWTGNHHWVMPSRDNVVVAEMTLDNWVKLSATRTSGD